MIGPMAVMEDPSILVALEGVAWAWRVRDALAV